MGGQNSKASSIIDSKFLKSLTMSTPLKNIDEFQTEVHEIISLSPQQQHIMLQKIRVKKNYDCPYVIKIIDSHSLQSKNLCSTIIKTYIVVEKPQSLADEIDQRLSLGIGFQQSQIWTLIYSSCLGASFLARNNVGLSRLTTSKIFIDIKGGIKINDPDFSQGGFLQDRIQQSQFISNLAGISQKLMDCKQKVYSNKLLSFLKIMKEQMLTLSQTEAWIKKNYLDIKKQSGNGALQIFSSTKKARKQKQNSKQMIRVTSGKKKSLGYSNKVSQSSNLTRFSSLSSYKSKQEDKENYKINDTLQHSRNQVELFTFKDQLKMDNINSQIHLQSHLFPRKALFGNRRKNQEKIRETNCEFQSQKKRTKIQISSLRQSQNNFRTRESSSSQVETQQSLDGSQLLNIISYQVDQQTFVREIGQQQSEYFLELMNQCKNSAKNYRY